MATVQVRNLLEPGDSTASMGNLAPIDFVAGIATVDEEIAHELHSASPYFELVEAAPPPEGTTTRSAPKPTPPADKEV